MKTDISFLPAEKQAELLHLSKLIQEAVPAEMIILFGSYARNEWVEDKYDDIHYRYQSDMDILVIVENKSDAVQEKFEIKIESTLEKSKEITTPVSVIVNDIDFVNKRLRKAQYFFTDIRKEGIVLYDSGKFILKEPKELLPEERKKLAIEDFNYYFEKTEKFLKLVHFSFSQADYSEAAFLLHQATERLYNGILLVFTRYKPNTHDLFVLRKLTNSVDNKLLKIFPLDTVENKRLFKLLKKAYVDARYKPSYKITSEELSLLIQEVEKLYETGKIICMEKINGFVNKKAV